MFHGCILMIEDFKEREVSGLGSRVSGRKSKTENHSNSISKTRFLGLWRLVTRDSRLATDLRRHRSKGMAVCLLMSLYIAIHFSLFIFHIGEVWADVGFQKVRFARGDVNGDGVVEVIAGGRVGDPVSVDVPRVARRAGVGVYRINGQLLEPLGVRNDLQVVQDVAAGDLDGNGRVEVVTVGMGRLTVFGWGQDGLTEKTRVSLEGVWTDRVTTGDVDNDGRAEVAATIYRVGADAEIGHTRVVIYRWAGNTLVEDRNWMVGLHVGDITGASDGWIVEVGAGEESGELQGLNANGWPIWQVSAAGRPRALSLDVLGDQLAVGRVDGSLSVYGLVTGQAQEVSSQRVPFLTALLFVPGKKSQVDLMIGTHNAGIFRIGF